MSEISDLNKKACGLVSPGVNVLVFANLTPLYYVQEQCRQVSQKGGLHLENVGLHVT